MSVFDVQPPIIDKKNLIIWLKSNYSFINHKSIKLKKLNSERDINFIVSINRKVKYVIKISNPSEDKDFLQYQDNLIKHLKKNKYLNYCIPQIYHSKIKQYLDLKKRKCFIRILSYIDGKMLGDIKSNEDIERSLGKFLGNTSIQLNSFLDNRAFRKFVWDPSNISWIETDINLFSGNKKNILLRVYKEYKEYIKKNLKNLRYSITHSDPNNYNIVVKNNQIVGLLDYGDSIYAPTINDLAICLSYALMNKSNLYDSLRNIISEYHREFPINQDEINSLVSLSKSRLMITVVMAKKQKIKYPSNKYLSISENDAWKLLKKLDKIPTKLLIFIIKNICNYPILNNYNLLCLERETRFELATLTLAT